ncbi:hypothetical protein PMM47T1_27734 [Pseudomonas sp. M47T1]|nr:hypothetical protein PMM47T1_27734 [Pseudomonas sp. M47T1]
MQYRQHWEHFYWVGQLLRLLACLVVVCALLELLLRQGALQRVRVLLAVQAWLLPVLLLAHWPVWLQCFGRRVLATVAFIQKNSSSRLKKDVHVSD